MNAPANTLSLTHLLRRAEIADGGSKCKVKILNPDKSMFTYMPVNESVIRYMMWGWIGLLHKLFGQVMFLVYSVLMLFHLVFAAFLTLLCVFLNTHCSCTVITVLRRTSVVSKLF